MVRKEKVPSDIKYNSTRPMPRGVVENPCPPRDPRYHEVWVRAMRESDRNQGRKRPESFYRRETHYDSNNNLWEPFWPDD